VDTEELLLQTVANDVNNTRRVVLEVGARCWVLGAGC
jgi:hypothetical protein